MQINTATIHTLTQGRKKKDAFTKAVAAAKRARKTEMKSIVVQMNKLGYERTLKALGKSESAGDQFTSVDFRMIPPKKDKK